MALKFERVAVYSLRRPRQRRAYPFHAVLKAAAPAFQDSQPDVCPGLAEEREVHAELVVLPLRRAGLGEQVLQPLLALGGESVDDLRSARPDRSTRDAASAW
jgi:hypothetical protein